MVLVVVAVVTTPHLKVAEWSNCKQRIDGQLTATDIKFFWQHCRHWFRELQSPSYFGPHPKCNCGIQCNSGHCQTGKSVYWSDSLEFFSLIISYSDLECKIISPIEMCLLCWECCTWCLPSPALWGWIPVGCRSLTTLQGIHPVLCLCNKYTKILLCSPTF